MLNRIDEIQGMGFHLDLVLRKIQKAYLRTFNELGVDTTIEQWVILYQIHQLGENASQRDIVNENFRNRATTSRVIGGLERKGWISKTRFEGDQKRFKLELTPKGKEILDTTLPSALQLRKLAIKDVDTSEFETFLRVLDKIGGNYEENEPQ
ncbi:MarR family winged helix-turn-helix transcriptional regulator [Flagellimonas halotolerans]|uniref:MarR family transcriptional regulator n=1 Tax=Flagellimonas halotolerans TaxID=3112164 RepID=A0ABU6IMP8_9FLAO|nr:MULTISPECIES: MarR family transcriptional regulator [unclassified Allomuricauda]MEC3964390.1 MarR family transcriptional regulator [Muricauda sp. SYSU M86414]MEC4264260.1 MarR family transcriptional regulator [Muricauda sp. SYSU M84420]